MKNLLLLFSISLIVGCTAKNYGPLGNVDGMPAEPGKCYAKCKSPVIYEHIMEERIIYTGEPTQADYLEHVNLTIEPASVQWEKKKADRNCLSADPEDCMVWCLVEKPAVKEEYILVNDTTQTDEFIIETFEYKEQLSGSGATEWQEVLCHNQVDREIVQQIGNVLADEGFYPNIRIPNKLNAQMTRALIEYQKEYGLYSGQLSLETLDHMQIQL